MYTVSGVFHGRTVEITWDDGKLSGDPEAVAFLNMLADSGLGQGFWTPTGIVVKDSRDNPTTAMELILMGLAFEPRPRIIAGADSFGPPVATDGEDWVS
jgi:hypothetical protein